MLMQYFIGYLYGAFHQLAVIGRPNVGKSTLINALTNSDRLVVSPVPHTTRDSVFVDFEYDGRAMKLIDTAGLMGMLSPPC